MIYVIRRTLTFTEEHRAKALLASGTLSKAEYENLKSKALGELTVATRG